MTDQPNKWSMPRFLSGAERSAEVIHMPERHYQQFDFTRLGAEIREAAKLLRVSDDEVEKAGIALDAAQETRRAREQDMNDLLNRWDEEWAQEKDRLGISGADNG